MPNTEKPTTIAQQKKSGIDGVMKKQLVLKVPVEKKTEVKTGKEKQETKIDEKKETSKKEPKKPIQTSQKAEPITTSPKHGQSKPTVKREYAVINAKSVPISAKYSIAICRFIKGKTIGNAIRDLEPVLILKKAIPMKGEIPHRKGKGMMSGRFPKKAVEHFIRLLKSLEANASVNEIDEPVIVETIANLAQRPYGRFGRTKKKRTHIRIKCVEKKIIKKEKKK